MYQGSSAQAGSGLPLLTAAATQDDLELSTVMQRHALERQTPENVSFGGQNFGLSPSSDRANVNPFQPPEQPQRHLRGACRRCKKMKMKCEYADAETGPCTRCKASEHACSVEPRKHLTHKSARSELLRQSQRKDELIAALVQHINQSGASGTPRSPGSSSGSSSASRGSPIQRAATSPPAVELPTTTAQSLSGCDLSRLDIIRTGAVRQEEVPGLFNLYFAHINVQLPLLDPAVHYPRAVFDSCSFLFTAICAVASRFISRPGAYSQAMECARKAAADALISDAKTVHMCQAYILLGEFSPPAATWEEDRSSLFRGLAIRLALDLNLGSKSGAGRNEQRTWLLCAWLDMQSGRAPSMPRDALLRATRAWCTDSPSCPASDVFLCACVELFGASSRFGELLVRGGRGDSYGGVSIDGTLRVCEDALTAVIEEWNGLIELNKAHAALYRRWFSFMYQYSKLRMLASILKRASVEVDGLYLRTWHAAFAAMNAVVEIIRAAPVGMSGFSVAPESLLAPAAYCATTIMQLLTPQMTLSVSIAISPESRQVALELSDELIHALSEGATPGIVSSQSPNQSQTHAQAHAVRLGAILSASRSTLQGC